MDQSNDELKDKICDALVEIDHRLMKEQPIASILKTGYAWLRFSVSKALGRAGDARSINIVLDMIENTFDLKDREYLNCFPDPSIDQVSTEVLSAIQRSASEIMGQLEFTGRVTAVLEAMLKCSPENMNWYIHSLGSINNKNSVNALIELLKKSDVKINPVYC